MDKHTHVDNGNSMSTLLAVPSPPRNPNGVRSSEPSPQDCIVIEGRPYVSLAYFEARLATWEQALATRDVISQAKGIWMERYGVDAAMAFRMLQVRSQSTNTKLRTVAEQVTTGEIR